MNASLSGGSIVDRAIGFIRLDDPTYEDVERDTNATTQAAIVVAVGAIASGIGGLREGAEGLIVGILGAFIGWVVISYLIYIVGTRLLPSAQTEADLGQILRVIGFAQVIQVVGILGILGDFGTVIAGLLSLWGIVMFVKAIKQSLEMSTGRAIATAVLAYVVLFLIAIILAAIFGVAVVI